MMMLMLMMIDVDDEIMMMRGIVRLKVFILCFRRYLSRLIRRMLITFGIFGVVLFMVWRVRILVV